MIFSFNLKTFIIISLLLHLSVFAWSPNIIKKHQKNDVELKSFDLNYMIINNPELAVEKEVYQSKHREQEIENENVTKEGAPSLVEDKVIFDQKSDNIEFAKNEIPAKRKESGENLNKSETKALLKYYKLIREKIRSNINKNAEGGNAVAFFTIKCTGEIIDCSVQDFSSKKVKKYVETGILTSAPFPHFTPDMGINPLRFSLQIQFGEK